MSQIQYEIFLVLYVKLLSKSSIQSLDLRNLLILTTKHTSLYTEGFYRVSENVPYLFQQFQKQMVE